MTKDSIIEAGSCRIRVKRQGLWQQITFEVRWVESAIGDYPVLHTDREIDLSEIIRVANEFGFAVEAKNGSVLPEGKSAKDLVEEFKDWK